MRTGGPKSAMKTTQMEGEGGWGREDVETAVESPFRMEEEKEEERRQMRRVGV